MNREEWDALREGWAFEAKLAPGVQSSEQSSASSQESSGSRGWKAMTTQLDAVLAYCSNDWRTLPEIAAALGRQPSTVRTKYLKPLLNRGALLRKYPDNPQHPHQAYRTAEERRR